MAPPERFSDTGPLCSQPLHHPSQCQFCSCAFLAGSVKKPGEANSCFNPLTIPLPRYFSFKMPLVFECSQIIVSVERIISLLLSWSLCLSGWPEKVLLLDDSSSLWEERAVICSSIQISKEGGKCTFSGVFCVWTPHTVGEEAATAQGSRFTDWDHHWGGLSWHSLAAGAPHGASASVHYEPAEKAPGARTRELTGKSPCSLHTPTQLCCCSVSFFFCLGNISYRWIVHCLCKVSPRGSPRGFSHPGAVSEAVFSYPQLPL